MYADGGKQNSTDEPLEDCVRGNIESFGLSRETEIQGKPANPAGLGKWPLNNVCELCSQFFSRPRKQTLVNWCSRTFAFCFWNQSTNVTISVTWQELHTHTHRHTPNLRKSQPLAAAAAAAAATTTKTANTPAESEVIWWSHSRL